MNRIKDEFFMKMALREAEAAMEQDEVPIGAVIVCSGTVVAKGHNLVEKLHDVTAHAEMIAITAASEYFAAKYLQECTIYVTLEPCLMCATALHWSQIERLVYGAGDPKKGFTAFNEGGSGILHPKTSVTPYVLENECSGILNEFFAGKREG